MYHFISWSLQPPLARWINYHSNVETVRGLTKRFLASIDTKINITAMAHITVQILIRAIIGLMMFTGITDRPT